MKILVTGLGGFLGGAIGTRLLAEGHSLRTISRRPLPEWEGRGVEIVRGPLENRATALEACQGIDEVFHVAAKAGVWGTYAEYYDSNVAGTRNILDACLTGRVPRLIFTSSPSATFDGGDALGVDESKPYPETFLNFYSETKAASEQLVLAANGTQGLATVALRPHLIWGPGDPHLLPRLLKTADAGRLRQVGNGDNLVDTTFVDNAAAAHLLAARDFTPSSPQAGKAYFISDGSPVRLWTWIDQLLQGLGRKPVRGRVGVGQARLVGGLLEYLYRTLRLAGEPPLTRFSALQLGTSHYYDISAAERDFGYRPQVDFAAAMERTLAHFRGQP